MKRVQEDAQWTLFDPYEVSELSSLYGEEFEKGYLELEQDESITKEIVSGKALWKGGITESYFEDRVIPFAFAFHTNIPSIGSLIQELNHGLGWWTWKAS